MILIIAMLLRDVIRESSFLIIYLLKKSVMGRPDSTVSLAFFLPGPGFCAAGAPSSVAPSFAAAALARFPASLQIP